MIDIKKNVISFMTEKIEKENYKRVDLANYLGVSKVSVTHYLNGTHAPDVNLYPKIAEFFNVTILELMGIKEIDSLSSEEIKVIEKYRDSSVEIKEAIKSILKI